MQGKVQHAIYNCSVGQIVIYHDRWRGKGASMLSIHCPSSTNSHRTILYDFRNSAGIEYRQPHLTNSNMIGNFGSDDIRLGVGFAAVEVVDHLANIDVGDRAKGSKRHYHRRRQYVAGSCRVVDWELNTSAPVVVVEIAVGIDAAQSLAEPSGH